MYIVQIIKYQTIYLKRVAEVPSWGSAFVRS